MRTLHGNRMPPILPCMHVYCIRLGQWLMTNESHDWGINLSQHVSHHPVLYKFWFCMCVPNAVSYPTLCTCMYYEYKTRRRSMSCIFVRQ